MPLRLLLAPLALPALLRHTLVGLGRPVVHARVDARHPLPSEACLRALADAGVGGVHLHLVSVHAGWASLEGVHAALLALREAGVTVVAELEGTGNAEVYVASAATRVVVRPASHVQLVGVGASLRFGGEALERLGVRVDVESAGAYKSLGEAFTRRFASAENREATRALVDDLQDLLEEGIATGRGRSRAQVADWLAQSPLAAEDAVARGLADAAAYPDEVIAWWKERLGREARRVELARWWKRRRARDAALARLRGGGRVVVVHLFGNVVEGDGQPGTPSIAPNPVVEAIDALREDDGVRAVVLHVKSPGGSAAASDLIWRAVHRLAETRPLVAVFGDVAASGGYYVAAPARWIVARAGTLTGSIGVVGGKLVLGGAAEKAGVHTEILLGAPMAGIWSVNRPFSDEERARFRQTLRDTYAAFLDRVSRGRGRPVDALEPLARGRVWTGARAREVGLVDAIGGVHEGVAKAAELAGLVRWRREDVHVGPVTGLLQKVVRRLTGGGEDPASALVARVCARLGIGPGLRQVAERPGEPLALALELEGLVSTDV
jgi:protease-4